MGIFISRCYNYCQAILNNIIKWLKIIRFVVRPQRFGYSVIVDELQSVYLILNPVQKLGSCNFSQEVLAFIIEHHGAYKCFREEPITSWKEWRENATFVQFLFPFETSLIEFKLRFL